MYNFYLRYNYKNIIPFNLKKNKLRIHSSLLATAKLKSFSIGHKIKFWYHYFGVNNLKRNNTILVKKFLNKKLSVFFISNFNMIEGKWSFPKIYLNYYKQYLYKRSKKYNLLKKKIIYNNNKYYLDYNFFVITKKLYKINIFNINFYFNLTYNFKFHINFYNFLLFKFNTNYTLPVLFIKTLKKKRNLKTNNKFFYNKKYKGVYNSWGFLNIYKKKNDLKKIINKMYLFYLNKFNLNYFIELKNNKILNKKFNILNVNKYIFDKKILIKFNILKKILNIIQFIKIFKELNKYFYKNICFWFYKNYINFKFIQFYKIKKIKKKKEKKTMLNKINKFEKSKKLKKIDFKIKKFKSKKFKLNLIYKKKKIKNILNWIKKLFVKLYKKNLNSKNLFYILNLKKKLKEYYKYKLVKSSYFYNYNLVNKYNIHYIFLGDIWWKYSFYSKVRRLKLLKYKKSKKLKRWFKNKYWIKQNNKTLLLYKTYYRFMFNNDNKRKILNFLKKLWNFNIFNYDYLWLRKKSKFNLNYLNSLNKYNTWLNDYNNNLILKNFNIINVNNNNIKKKNKEKYKKKYNNINKRFYSNFSFNKKNNNKLVFFDNIYENIEKFYDLQKIKKKRAIFYKNIL